MRPIQLAPLFTTLQALGGVGPKSLKLYERLLGGYRWKDVLFHKPVSITLRQKISTLAEGLDAELVEIVVLVHKHKPNFKPSQPYRVIAIDAANEFFELTFFNVQSGYLEQIYPEGSRVRISGKLERFKGKAQIIHPERLTEESNGIEVVYPLTAGLTNKAIRKTVVQVLEKLPELPEWLDEALLKRENWQSWGKALNTLHNPESQQEISAENPARKRLAYDELLANQLALSIMRVTEKGSKGHSFEAGEYRKNLEAALPFTLTDGQRAALADIDHDMGAPTRMMRLVQGDVGSGKTIVAALAMMTAVDSGFQAAIMAPTEILARQHAESFSRLLAPIGLAPLILTGRDKGKAREKLTAQIASGAARVIIGTHALFQESIEFKNLGLAVIDEQHRFGVGQRLALAQKGIATDVLVMTATPIPRTLEMTSYGDMDVSRILQKPPGRKPIDTRLISQERAEDMLERLTLQMQQGAQIYWICPLVEQSEMLDLQAAEDRYALLHERYGDKVGLIHGKMKAADKDAVMARFEAGDIKLLVSTTVVEVGVNVPNATIMVIEHAERFGLAQLHQLRGRVGRGEKQSYCFLMYTHPLSLNSKERLSIMRETEDGFLIAEKDLALRGSGDILGTQQSGLPEFHFADLSSHSDLLAMAHDEARLIISKNANLAGERGEALRTLLYLHERDKAVSYLRAG